VACRASVAVIFFSGMGTLQDLLYEKPDRPFDDSRASLSGTLIAAASEVTPARVATSAADIDLTRDRMGCSGVITWENIPEDG
jgi:hypothetical protein